MVTAEQAIKSPLDCTNAIAKEIAAQAPEFTLTQKAPPRHNIVPSGLRQKINIWLKSPKPFGIPV